VSYSAHELLFVFGQSMHNRLYTAISIKVAPEQSGEVEYERERLLGIAKKLMNLLAIPSSLYSRSYSTFPLCSGTNLIEIAVYTAEILRFHLGHFVFHHFWKNRGSVFR
jgi:hypothetical protein